MLSLLIRIGLSYLPRAGKVNLLHFQLCSQHCSSAVGLPAIPAPKPLQRP
jgi:hypothetical protein